MATLTKKENDVVCDIIDRLQKNANAQCFGYTSISVCELDENGDPDFDYQDEYHCVMHHVLSAIEEHHENPLTYIPLNMIDGWEDFIDDEDKDYSDVRVRDDETGEIYKPTGSIYRESATEYMRCECGDNNCEVIYDSDDYDSAYWHKHFMWIPIHKFPEMLKKQIFNDISQADIVSAERFEKIKGEINYFGVEYLPNLNDWGVSFGTLADIFRYMLALSNNNDLPITGE